MKAGIDTIPVELVERIFSAVLDAVDCDLKAEGVWADGEDVLEHYRALTRFMLVCKAWLQVIEGAPHLWSYIHNVLKPAFNQKCITLSRETDIDIELLPPTAYGIRTTLLCAELTPESRRWRSLTVSNYAMARELVVCPIPKLQRLRLEYIDKGDIVAHLMASAASLLRLELIWVALPQKRETSMNVESLKLVTSGYVVTQLQLVAFAACFRHSLRTLDITHSEDILPRPVGRTPQQLPTIHHFPHLNYLRVSGIPEWDLLVGAIGCSKNTVVMLEPQLFPGWGESHPSFRDCLSRYCGSNDPELARDLELRRRLDVNGGPARLHIVLEQGRVTVPIPGERDRSHSGRFCLFLPSIDWLSRVETLKIVDDYPRSIFPEIMKRLSKRLPKLSALTLCTRSISEDLEIISRPQANPHPITNDAEPTSYWEFPMLTRLHIVNVQAEEAGLVASKILQTSLARSAAFGACQLPQRLQEVTLVGPSLVDLEQAEPAFWKKLREVVPVCRYLDFKSIFTEESELKTTYR